MRTSNIQSLTCNAQWHRIITLSALSFALCAHDLDGQVGNNNPTGVSGIFNGQAGACGYDPYTGNATRSITDIAVAGAVGEYPLALVRTANSRAPSTTEVFAWSGGWNHNYNWIMEDSPPRNGSNLPPTQYTVDFPDGRVETFKSVTWDPGYYRVRLGADGSAGVRERVAPIDPPGNMYAFLILPDGGKVKFQATQYSAGGQYFYKYKATAIIDPHGLETILTWENFGNGRKRLQKVTEPAGRYLQFTYTAPNSSRISQVQEFINTVGRRRVQYFYYFTAWLDHVVYYDNPTWTARYQYVAANAGGPDLPPLLWTCDDPMYPGPMKRIAYEYKTGTNPDGTTAVYGQILSERYWDGVSGSGAAVSTLTVGEVPNVTTKRKETRGDGVPRKFVYDGAGYVTWASDFTDRYASQSYDAKKYINSVSDRRGNTTDYTNNPITGNVTQVKFPLTPADTLGQGNTRPTINYTYTNNYYLNTIHGENGQITTITRGANNRVTRIDYPDGGYETFGYDSVHLYQLSSHRMKTGGTETFAYDGQHRLQYYSDPYHNNTNNPSKTYYYDTLHRVSGIADALNHSTNFDYNDRGQVTLTTLPWINNVRYTISNLYNPDGTLQSRTDELGHRTSYEYDDYRRLKSVTPPVRGSGDNGIYTTRFYYGANPWDGVNDYKLTDSNVTYVVPPSTSTRKIKAVYDDNRRKTSVTVAPGTADEATTGYGYDYVGNLRTVSNPQPGHVNLTTNYDERNRPYQVIVGPFQTTTINYDTAGRRKTVQHPNGQTITYDTFDAMNRVTQQTATQSPGPDAVTKFSYYTSGDGPNAPVGLLKTMKDPRLVQLNNGQAYTYEYDLMGRKKKITYPKDSMNVNRTERWTYDTVGRLETFTNRASKVQTFGYDQLNRVTGFSWNDGGLTPSVSFAYDEASRLIEIDNANASISRTYYDDNLLHMETQSLSAVGGVDNRHVTYTYDEDSNRASLAIPGYAFDYLYTNRNQVRFINKDTSGLTQAYYEYDLRGNVTLRNVNTSPVTASNYNYDTYGRVTSISHTLNGTTRTFNYGYDSDSDNRLWAKRGIIPTSPENNKGEAFSYDLADQAIAFHLNVANPQNVSQPLPRNIVYDPNGNRTSFQAVQYGATTNLSQYTTRTGGTTAAYDSKGNMITGLDGSTYTYDAQNRLTQASENGTTMIFEYDGLNRQVSRTVGGVTTYSTWDGWNLVEEYTNNPFLVVQARYLYGPTGLIKELQNNRYYCQDGSGSTALLADSTAHLLEWYRYDLQGAPFFYDANDSQLSASNYAVRHLFAGQQWYSDIGLYDLRNRFYSPDIGRFLQPDPIGFRGDRSNLYRYCRNNPVTRSDPFGLQAYPTAQEKGIEVFGDPVPPLPGNISDTGFLTGDFGSWGGIPWAIDNPGGIFIAYKDKPSGNHKGNGQRQSSAPPPSAPPPQNSQAPAIFQPTTTAEFILAGNIIERGDTTDTTPAIDPIDLLSGGIAALVRSSFRSVVTKVIGTPYGRAIQSTSAEARAALRQVQGGATVYKGGVLGRSETSASQFLSLENPLNPGYAGRYGIPPQNSNFDFILSGRVQPGAPVITRPAPGIPPNPGEGIEAVTNPGSFRIDSFYMPD
jgi:RHS repeat-associated protein